MEQGPEKRPDPEATGGFAGALTGFLADSDEEGGLSPELPIEEELVEKVMHELYEAITGQNDFANVPAAPPPPPHQQQPPASVEKNGENGSCGASVSETASTVMAGVHFTCRAGGLSGPSGGGEGLGEEGEAGGGGGGVGLEIDDDEWLEKALSWVPLMEGLGGGL